MATNIIVAKFCAEQTRAWTDELWQYDYGQILKFDGLELPDAYEVHFSNQPLTGETITQIGTADGVTIPDQFLQNGKSVYAWIYLHTGEDDGETEYMVTIPVSKRAKPTNQTPTPVQQDAITEAIAALNAAVEDADELAREWENMTATAETLPEGSAATASYSEGTLTLGIPRGATGAQGIPGQDGEDGAPGAPGEDGFSPEITVQDITGGHRITITDATGTSTVDVMDGEDGQPGQPGQPGATGNGIASITKTGTVGLVDTYTITYTNGQTTTFTVTNGSDATVTVDDALSTTSENPVQNKVINGAISGLSDDLNQLSQTVDGKVDDVQIDGSSIVNNGVANIPKIGTNRLGAVMNVANNGLVVTATGAIYIDRALSDLIKAPSTSAANYKPIVPNLQHESAFYGLAKASGDTTQSSSSNPVGTYTDDAKDKIQKMLGLNQEAELINAITVAEDSTSITIETDSNGLPFALKAAKIQMKMTASTTGNADYISVQYMATLANGTSTNWLDWPTVRMNSATGCLNVYEFESIGGLYFLRASTARDYGGSSGNMTTMNMDMLIKSINKIKILRYSSTMTSIPAGTVIKIYGVRL